MEERPHLLPRRDRFRRVRNPILEVVHHSLIEIQFHWHAGSIEGLVKAHKAAEQSFLQPALNEGRREPFREVAIDRRRIRIF
jgi:hypothetical protein